MFKSIQKFLQRRKQARLAKRLRVERERILTSDHNVWLVHLMVNVINQGNLDQHVIARHKAIQYHERRANQATKGGRRVALRKKRAKK